MNQSYLLNTLKGCLHSSSVKESEQALGQLSLQSDFLENLLKLIPSQQHNILILVLSTIKNYLTARYNDPNNPIPSHQKQLLKDNILNLFYQLANNNNAISLYQQIIYIVIAVDYPWPTINEVLVGDLQSQVVASVHFLKQVALVFEYLMNHQRQILEGTICQFFPVLEGVVENILTNFNQQTGALLVEILEILYCCLHVHIPRYIRDFNIMDKWILYLQTALKVPAQSIPEIKRLTLRVFAKLLSMYTSDSSDSAQTKGWAANFRNRYGYSIYNLILSSLGLGNEEIDGTSIKCIYEVCKNKDLRSLITQQHCQGILYRSILPMMQRNPEDKYIRREDDLTIHFYRRSCVDLVEMMMTTLEYNQKPQLLRFVEYSANVLENNQSKQQEKEVIVYILTKIHSIVLKNKYLKSKFQKLISQYFIPLLKKSQPFLIVRVCQLLTTYLPSCQISQSCVQELMGLVYQMMLSNNLVVKFHSVLAFTALMKQPSALEIAKPHFSNILNIYVKLLNEIDDEKLLNSLETIVENFSTEIRPVACDLINHLISLFYAQCKPKQKQENEDDPQDDDNNITSASAALSTISQIIQSQLSNEQYLTISQQILQLLVNMFRQLDGYFQEVLNLFNVFVFNSSVMIEYQFAYLVFRKLLEGNNAILGSSTIDGSLVSLIAETERADQQHWQTIISILKNLIQKMPAQIFHKFPYPSHPQLLLCIIQNQKIPQQSLQQLDTSEVQPEWASILQSYTAVVYKVGAVSNPQNVKIMTGVSLYPWLLDAFGPSIVKKVLLMISEEEDEDFEDENTMQMLQRYAQQDEEQQQADVYVSSGVNYSFNYQSPFDSENDKKYLLERLKSLSQDDAMNLLNQLSPQYQKKLKALSA